MTKDEMNIIFGLDDKHIFTEANLQLEVYCEFKKLKEVAAKENIALDIASGFRSFERQRIIWNEKTLGLREVLDDESNILQKQDFNDWQWLEKILRFSALPGTSRHHWGTDFDVIDKNALKVNQSFNLTPEETHSGGIFERLHFWMDELFNNENNSFGFYRPYNIDNNGVSPERWHLSYRPLSKIYQEKQNKKSLFEFLSTQEFEMKHLVLNRLDEIYDRFVSLVY